MNNEKKTLKENAFDAAPGGAAGSVNFQPGYGITPAFAFQDPAKFDSSNYNKDYNVLSTGQPDTQITDTSGSFNKDVDKLFLKKEKPTPDDVLCGIQYELQRMIKKDKKLAKEIVIDNLKKHGPKYYTGLNMLNINDDDGDEDTSSNKQMKERVDILNKMFEDKKNKREAFKLNDSILGILNEEMEYRIEKSNELIKKSIKG